MKAKPMDHHATKAQGSGATRRRALAVLGAAGAATAACGEPKAPLYDGIAQFLHGVASGDPARDRVIIWTRLTPERDGAAPVRWVVAKDEALKQVVKSGTFTTDASRDYTVKVDVAGLRPGQRYFYGFSAGKAKSPIGRTRTLPKGDLDRLKIAAASCSHFGFGFFNAYEEIAKRADIDVVLHLGDYIYEYGLGGYASNVAAKIGRLPDPPTEISSLADYRRRFAQYRTDPDLQRAHSAHPWIVTWDDHEHTNDAWKDGAENHNPENSEGEWEFRKRFALQAYYEWMPIREPEAGRPLEAIQRSFQFGDLATLILLETRILARDLQLDYEKDMPPVSTPWDFSNPSAPRPLSPEEAKTADPKAVRLIPTPFDVSGAKPVPILDLARTNAIDPANLPQGVRFFPDVERFKREMLANPQRQLLGAAQEAWFKEALAASAKAKSAWRIVGNQVMMARINAPNLAELLSPAQRDAARKVAPNSEKLIEFSRFGMPINLDAWDGYPAARTRLYETALAANADMIVLTGDSHESWACELFDDADQRRVGVEFGAPSITSSSYGDLFQALGFDSAKAFADKNKEVVWNDGVSRGFVLLTLTKKDAQAEFIKVSNILSKQYSASVTKTFRIARVKGAGMGALEGA